MEDIFSKAKLFGQADFMARATRSSSYSGGGLGFFFFFWTFIWLALYIYSALVLMLIAKKTSTSGAWMAWVPILNIFLMCKVAGKSLVWFILFLIPFVNIIAVVLVWAAIAERLKRPSWWGILMLIPIANLIIPGILAFSKGGATSASKKKAAPSEGPTCSKCGASIEAADKFCPDCGGKITRSGKLCPKCGAKVSGKFCPSCGAKV